MRKELWSGQNSVRFIYYTYKDSSYFTLLLASVTLLVIIFLIFNVVIPQFQNWFSIRNEVIAAQQRIATLNNNISFISSLNKEDLEAKRRIVINALPVEKDFAHIISSLDTASVRTGVTIDDFSFGLGSISSPSAAEARLKKPNEPESVIIALTLKGDINSVKNFMREINQKLPVNNIDSVEAGKNSTTLSLVFYSKSYRPPVIVDDNPINPISPENNSLLNTLSAWNSDSFDTFEELPPPSSSTPLF